MPAIDGLEGKDRGVKFVKLATGNLGQNTTNPYPAFDNHFVVIFDGKIYDPSYGTPFADAAGADIAAKLAANQLAFEKASIAGFVRLAAREVTHNDLEAQAGATRAFAYLYREHSGKVELKMLKMPNPNPTVTPR